jgi:hypothetical protein
MNETTTGGYSLGRRRSRFFSRNPDTRLQGMMQVRFRTVPQRPRVKVLRKGFRGAEVQRLQKLLNLRTYPCPALAVDGIFGPKTYDAVRRYQRAASLPNDGVVGANTWFSLLEGKQVRLPPTVPLTRADFPTTSSQATSLTAAPSATPAGKPEPPVSQSSPKQTPPKASVPSAQHKQITIWEWPLEKKLTVALSRVPERLPGKARDEFTALLQFENLALSLVIIAGFCLLSGGTALVVGALIFGFDIAMSLASALQTASLAATEDELNEAADELAHVVLAVGVAAFIKGVGKIAKGRAAGGKGAGSEGPQKPAAERANSQAKPAPKKPRDKDSIRDNTEKKPEREAGKEPGDDGQATGKDGGIVGKPKAKGGTNEDHSKERHGPNRDRNKYPDDKKSHFDSDADIDKVQNESNSHPSVTSTKNGNQVTVFESSVEGTAVNGNGISGRTNTMTVVTKPDGTVITTHPGTPHNWGKPGAYN